MREVFLQLSTKQKEAFKVLRDNKTTELFYGGGAGGGKSYIGCIWLIFCCLNYPGTRWLMGRAKLKSLKESTLLSFFAVLREWGLKKDIDWKYNSIEGIVTFLRTKSTVYLKDLFLYPSDPEFDSLGSTEYTGAFMDEVSEITEKAKMIVMSRLRYKLVEYNLMPKLLMASNPTKNFAYREYWKPWRDGNLKSYRKFIPALVKDNPFMPEIYAKNLKKMDKRSRERLLYGNWNYDDDPALLFDFDQIVDIFTNEANRGKKFLTIDVAGGGKDDTKLIFWDGLFIEDIETRDNIDTFELDEILKECQIPRSQCIADNDGVGYGLVKDTKGIRGFVNNGKPVIPKIKRKENIYNYKHLKAQCWFLLSDYVNSGRIGCYRDISISDKKLLIEDLEIMKEKDMDKENKKLVTTKEEIKEMLGRSTDLGDAMMMRMWFELRNPVLTK